jgi:hypothetical protein
MINENFNLNWQNDLATIKKPGDVEHISKDEYEWRIKEIAKCKRDITYFAENYYRIIGPDGLQIIKLYDIQKEFLKFLVENNYIICMSGRQQGKCQFFDTKIKIRNKKTGEIKEVKIGDFFNKIAKK